MIASSIFAVVLLFLYKSSASNYASNSNPTITEESTTEEQLKSVINLNLKAMEEEDLEEYLSTITGQSDQMIQTEEFLKKLFTDFDLKYTIEDFKVLTTGNEDAQVQVVQTTKRLRGLDFKDNRATIIHHLKQIDGK